MREGIIFLEPEALDVIARALILSLIALCWVIFTVRVVGLRAFSKMTAFDFVVTVATGSLLAGASQASDWPGFAQPTLAISTLLGAQYFIARLRQSSPTAANVLMNRPMLIMRDGEMIDEALKASRVSEDDLLSKLREADVHDISAVRAVVLETTGDISVLHGDGLEERLLDGVRMVR